MSRTILPCGEHAVLVEIDDDAERAGLVRSLQQTPIDGVVDVVPGARTVLLDAEPGTDLTVLARAVRGREVAGGEASVGIDRVTVQVQYDGDDLTEVARLLGCSEAAVVDAHTDRPWTVAFCGFAPGFGYLTRADDRLHVPRRTDSRTRVPAGSVGLAGEYSGVYPTPSPGGWQLIGRTDAVLWDLDREPPALFRPGGQVQFRAVRVIGAAGAVGAVRAVRA